MNKIIFLDARKGTSKKGNDFQVVQFAQLVTHSKQDGSTVCRTYIRDFFVDSAMDLSGFHFGDEVQATFEASEFIGGKPELLGITLLEASPYFKKEV